MTSSAAADLRLLARSIRLHVLRMTSRARSSHVGSCFSVADILAVLYAEVLRVDPHNPAWPERDRFVLSKGHSAAALYAVLAERGFFSPELLDTFCADGSMLAGHAVTTVPGVEVSTGSLGHGLSVATGMALAAKRDRATHRVVAVLSDGECDEGSVWEAVLFAPQHRLDNLTVIVDYNKIQSLAPTRDVVDLEPFADKWRAFRWHTVEVDGHDHDALRATLTAPPQPGRPTCVIAHTIKGKGVSFMENTVLWHYRSPQGDELSAAVREVESA